MNSATSVCPEIEIPLQNATTATHPHDLSADRSLLQRFERDVERAGLVGERQNAKIILLTAVSARLQKPLNVSVGGASSAGKNHLIGCVARFIPEEHKKILTGMSPKTLMHAEEDEYQHKAVFIAEYEGVKGADYAIRTMQSEHSIDWEFVECSAEGIQKKKRQVKGPVAFIQATTRVMLHPENETRLLFLQMDESEAQTSAINCRQAMEAEGGISPMPPDLFAEWCEFFRSLKAAPVRIPFAKQLAKEFPVERVRSRRDFPKLLGLIEISAYLHQHHRPSPDGNILAAPQDYLIAKELFEHCYDTGPDRVVGDLVKIAEAIGKDFTVTDLMAKIKWGKSKTYQVLGRAQELGCVGDGDRRRSHRFLRKHTESPLKLPPQIRLSATDFRNSTEIPLSPPVTDKEK